MKKSRFTEEQIIGFLRQADAGMPVKELSRKSGFETRPGVRRSAIADLGRECQQVGNSQAAQTEHLRAAQAELDRLNTF